MKWMPGYKTESLPPIDNADYPKQYVVRVKGDDPHSGWIYIGHETAEEMRDINEDGYWEWLDESPSDVSVLKEALKNIAQLCGVVNFSSHNQMKEAVNGAMDIAEAALSEYSTQSLSQPRSPQGNIKPRPLAASFLDWISFEGYMRLSEPAGHKWFKIGQAAETYSTDELLEMFCTEINNDSQPDNRESKGAPAGEIEGSISEGEEWQGVDGKRYLLIDDKLFYVVAFDQWDDGDFEADAVNGGFRVLVSKNTSGYFVANAMDEGGNNCKNKYINSKVTLLTPYHITRKPKDDNEKFARQSLQSE